MTNFKVIVKYVNTTSERKSEYKISAINSVDAIKGVLIYIEEKREFICISEIQVRILEEK